MKNLLSTNGRCAGAGEKFYEALEARAYLCADFERVVSHCVAVAETCGCDPRQR